MKHIFIQNGNKFIEKSEKKSGEMYKLRCSELFGECKNDMNKMWRPDLHLAEHILKLLDRITFITVSITTN